MTIVILLIRFLPDKVNGVMQGAAIPFLETAQLGIGNNRFAFDADDKLWIGKTHLGWAGDEGIKSVKWNRQEYLFVKDVSLTAEGFKLQFSMPLMSMPELKLEAHTYHYHSDYGSPKIDHKKDISATLKLSNDKQTLWVKYPELQSAYTYTISINNAQTANSQHLLGDVVRYTVNQIPRGYYKVSDQNRPFFFY
ncbi:hypothetical protein [Agaribacter flavus]|uniref:Uncharacterized protein n=1 Tax=Agaribacter flavus TaxID=1902781 RepID=A0ABV7FU47_9ALTE